MSKGEVLHFPFTFYLSFFQILFLDFGGMHPNNFINGTTIDMKTGKQLNLSDITSVDANLIEHKKQEIIFFQKVTKGIKI